MDLVADPCDEISSPHASDTYEHRNEQDRRPDNAEKEETRPGSSSLDLVAARRSPRSTRCVRGEVGGWVGERGEVEIERYPHTYPVKFQQSWQKFS